MFANRKRGSFFHNASIVFLFTLSLSRCRCCRDVSNRSCLEGSADHYSHPNTQHLPPARRDEFACLCSQTLLGWTLWLHGQQARRDWASTGAADMCLSGRLCTAPVQQQSFPFILTNSCCCGGRASLLAWGYTRTRLQN